MYVDALILFEFLPSMIFVLCDACIFNVGKVFFLVMVSLFLYFWCYFGGVVVSFFLYFLVLFWMGSCTLDDLYTAEWVFNSCMCVVKD